MRNDDRTGEYARFLTTVDAPWCWACGRGPSDRPRWWYGPWAIQRAHVAHSPRVRDVRAIVLLCPVCHARAHREFFSAIPDAPPLTQANLLWIKRTRDPRRYDRKFLARLVVGRLPIARRPPDWYGDQYCTRRPDPVRIGTAWTGARPRVGGGNRK